MKKFTCRPKAGGNAVRLGNAGGGRNADYIQLGRLAESGPVTPVHLLTEKPLVVAIVGKRGSGKSYTLGSVAESLCTTKADSSLGQRGSPQTQLLFDTLGIFQWMDRHLTTESTSETIRIQALAQRGWSLQPEELSLEVWIPKGSRANWTPDTHKEFALPEDLLSADDWGYLLGLDIATDRMGQLLADVFTKVTDDGWNDGSVSRTPIRSGIIRNMIECANLDVEVISLYAPETRRALSQQLTAIGRLGIFDQVGTGLEQLLRVGQLSVLVLNKLADSVRLAILTSLTRTIMRARIEASELSKQALISGDTTKVLGGSGVDHLIPPCWVEIDEAQNILPSERKTSATDTLVRLVREGRNYGISFAVTTQQPSSIDQRLMAQVDVMVIHKLSVQADIDHVARNIKSILPDEVSYGGRVLTFAEIVRSLDTGQALVSHVDADRAYLVDIRPRISVHGGFAT